MKSIPNVIGLTYGPTEKPDLHEGYEVLNRDYSFYLCVDFKDAQALKEYQPHPVHLVVKKVRHAVKLEKDVYLSFILPIDSCAVCVDVFHLMCRNYFLFSPLVQNNVRD